MKRRAAGAIQGDVFVKKVVFVCVENSNRSQMAEASARIHGAGKVDERVGSI